MENSSGNKLISGLSIQTVITVSTAVLQIVVFSIFSRLLGREEFGYYAAITGVVSILSSISDAGIGSSLIQKKNVTDLYRSTAFSLSLTFGIIAALINLCLSPVISEMIADKTIIKPLQILSVSIVMYSLQGYCVSSLRKELKFKTVGICKLTSYTIASGVGILLAVMNVGLYSLVIMTLLDSVLYMLFLFGKTKLPSLGFNFIDAKKIISFGGWLTLGVIVTSISNQLDKIILGRRIGVKALGEYNRPAGFISNSISMANTIFDIVLFPILSTFQDSKEHFKALLKRSISLLSDFGNIFSFMLCFNSPLIIIIFFGYKWIDLLPVMRIVSLGASFMMLNTLCDCFFRSFNLVRIGFYIRLTGLIIWIFLIILGSSYGLVGVAIAVLISNFSITTMKILYLCHKSETKVIDIIKVSILSYRPSLPILVIGLFFLLFPNNFYYLILQLIMMMLSIIILMIQYPKFFGEEYMNLLYPKVIMIKNYLQNGN